LRRILSARERGAENGALYCAVDCAEICRLAAAYMSRDSECALDACALCADVCDACA
jgi:hypothetical protein